jgi:hypothetical protein
MNSPIGKLCRGCDKFNTDKCWLDNNHYCSDDYNKKMALLLKENFCFNYEEYIRKD